MSPRDVWQRSGVVLGLVMMAVMIVYNAFYGLFNSSAWVYFYRSLEAKPVVTAEKIYVA